MNDQQRLVRVVREAQVILTRSIERGPKNATQTVIDLLAIIDRKDVVEAVDRLEVEAGLGSHSDS